MGTFILIIVAIVVLAIVFFVGFFFGFAHAKDYYKKNIAELIAS